MQKYLRKLLKRKKFWIKAQGNSMWPLLHENDLVHYKRINYLSTKINDIVLIKKDFKLYTHRVIYRNKKHFITKGDNNPISDGKFTLDRIVGKVTEIKI